MDRLPKRILEYQLPSGTLAQYDIQPGYVHQIQQTLLSYTRRELFFEDGCIRRPRGRKNLERNM